MDLNTSQLKILSIWDSILTTQYMLCLIIIWSIRYAYCLVGLYIYVQYAMPNY